MTNHDEQPAALPALVWAVIFTLLLVAAVVLFALVLVARYCSTAPYARHSGRRRMRPAIGARAQ